MAGGVLGVLGHEEGPLCPASAVVGVAGPRTVGGHFEHYAGDGSDRADVVRVVPFRTDGVPRRSCSAASCGVWVSRRSGSRPRAVPTASPRW
jgi:hypothetical protein